MELWGVVPLYLFFIAIFVVTSIIFVLQEMVPILRHFIEPTVDPQIAVIRPSEESPVGKALRGISAALPDVFIIHDEELALFSNTRGKPAIYLSAGLANQLTAEQIQAAVAHEMAHIARSKFPVLLAGFILRTLMFFNPVVLVEFRRAIRNEEKICDDIAVSLTGKPFALAETLKKFYSRENEEDPVGRETPGQASRKISLEEYSHNLQSANEATGDWPASFSDVQILFASLLLLILKQRIQYAIMYISHLIPLRKAMGATTSPIVL